MKNLCNKIFSYSISKFIITAIVVNLLIEIFSRKTLSSTLNYVLGTPLVFLYNALIIFFTLTFSYLFKRRKLVFRVITSIWIGFGVTNGIILRCRVTPFTATDFRLIKAGLAVSKSYLSPLMIGFIICSIIALFIGFIRLLIHGPKVTTPINYKKNIILIASLSVFVMLSTKFLINFNIISDYFGNIAFAYLDYGFPYCFSNTLLNTGIKKPQNYSKETIANILNTEVTTGAPITLASNTNSLSTKSSKSNPNIIMLQLESFFDPTLLEDIEFSSDPIPNFRELMKNYSSGYLNVPSVGAGTANTEFEVISGMSLDFFGPGEYPYKTILKRTTCESINYTLKDIGYSTHAIHNNTGTFYDRDFVFSQLGFDTFTSLEYMEDIVNTPTGWSKDYILTDEILKALASTDGNDFVYTISVQGHGDYPTEKILNNPEITVSGLDDEEKLNAFTYYINEIHEMDKFIKELTYKLSQLDEEVILVMYGDHLPTLGLEESDLKNHSLFQTEYVIWNNFNLPKEDKTLEAFQLSSTVLNSIGIDNGILNRYHHNACNAIDYMDNLKLLQYDMLYGKKYVYNGENPFVATEMKMGVHDITISNAYEINGQVFIEGDGFTAFSKVLLNNKEYDTTYVSSTLLMVDDASLIENDIVTVSQVTHGGTTLSTTNEYIIN